MEINSSTRRSDWPEALRYVGDSGDSNPSCFAKALIEALPIEAGKTRFLDLGCGTGIAGIICLVEKEAAFASFNDVQEKMIMLAKTNVYRFVDDGVVNANQVAFLHGDFAQLPNEIVCNHTLIGFNPPQLPEAYLERSAVELLHQNASAAIFRLGEGEKNPDGLSVARKYLQWYANLPHSKPDAIICLSSFLGFSRIEKAFLQFGLAPKVVSRIRVPLRQILARAADSFESDEVELSDRLLKKMDDGCWTKELLVLRL